MTEHAPYWLPPDFIPGSTPPIPASTDETKSSSDTTDATPALEAERKRWVGYLAFAPKYVTGQHGLRVSFVVSEHSSDRQTIYHRVYATKRFAEQIQKSGMERGQLIDVAGQLQMRDTRQKDGSIKPMPVVYAYGVRVLGNAKG